MGKKKFHQFLVKVVMHGKLIVPLFLFSGNFSKREFHFCKQGVQTATVFIFGTCAKPIGQKQCA